MGGRPGAAQERNDAAGEGEAASAAKLASDIIDWIQAFRKHEAKRNAGDPGRGAGAAAEQRRVRLHDPRPDRRRHPADAGVPRRSRQRGRLRQLGGIAGDVAGPGEEVPGGGAAGRRPPRPEAATASPSRRTRWSPTPTATSTACGGSSTSTSGSGPTTPTTSWPPGGSSIAQALGQPEATLADFAAEAGVSPKYLATIWSILTEPAEEVGPDRRAAGDVAGAAAPRRRQTAGRRAAAAASGCATSSSSSASSSCRRSRT